MNEGSLAPKAFRCGECGGRLRRVEVTTTDASRGEKHECVDCGGQGGYYNSHNPKTPRLSGVTTRRTNLND